MKKPIPIYLRIILSVLLFAILFFLLAIFFHWIGPWIEVEYYAPCLDSLEGVFESWCYRDLTKIEIIRNKIFGVSNGVVPILIPAIIVFLLNKYIKKKGL